MQTISNISLNIRLDKTFEAINSRSNTNLIENFKSIFRLLFYRISSIEKRYPNILVPEIIGVISKRLLFQFGEFGALKGQVVHQTFLA